MLRDKSLVRDRTEYPWVPKLVSAMRDGHWTVESFDFSQDKIEFQHVLDETVREMLIRTLTGIAQIELPVKTFWFNVPQVLQHPAMLKLCIKMADIEDIHEDAYAELAEELGQSYRFQENMKVPAVFNRVLYLQKHTEKIFADDFKQFIYSLILFTLFVENVSLFTQFYIVLWVNRTYGLMKVTANQVKYTRNEEALHGLAGTYIIRELQKEYPEYFDAELEQRVQEACQLAYQSELNLLDWMLVDNFEGPGLSKDLLANFIRNRLNESLVGIGYDAPFEVNDQQLEETDWMTNGIYLPVLFDSFASRNTEYLMGDLAAETDFTFED